MCFVSVVCSDCKWGAVRLSAYCPVIKTVHPLGRFGGFHFGTFISQCKRVVKILVCMSLRCLFQMLWVAAEDLGLVTSTDFQPSRSGLGLRTFIFSKCPVDLDLEIS